MLSKQTLKSIEALIYQDALDHVKRRTTIKHSNANIQDAAEHLLATKILGQCMAALQNAPLDFSISDYDLRQAIKQIDQLSKI